MKKVLCVLVAAIFMFSSAVAHAAASDELVTGMGKKLVRGVVNTCTGWIELPAQIAKGYNRGFGGKENLKALGAGAGIFAGIGCTIGRTLSGAFDLAGFWAADPKSNEGVGLPLDAEFAWEEGEAYPLFDPSFGEATIKPIGNKIARGAANTVLGVAEIPGQIVKGVKLKAMDAGVFKGLWYFASREMDGASDLASFLYPNPKDTKGLAFDETWAWSALGDSNCK
jgi:putative exosortase-associated protein (TIGR04073 family)